MTDWKTALREACKKTTQRNVASKIGYSATTINLVLSDNYKGDVAAVENAVRKKLMCSTIKCPELGQITAEECSSNQRKPFSASSSARVRLFKACKKCPFNTRRKEDA